MIAIIGAGISGLSLGHYLLKNGNKDFVIYEKEAEPGGKIKTSKWNSINLEHGPNTLMSTPLLLDFVKELGIEKEIIYPDESVVKQRYIKLNGEITELPSAPQKILFGNIIGLKSKASIFKDLFFKPRKIKNKETVAEFFANHFSEEIVEKLVTPFCRGIYATEPEELILKTTFLKLAEIQEKYGSVIKGLKKTQSVEKRRVFNFKNGIASLVYCLENELKDHIIYDAVSGINKDGDNYVIKTSQSTKEFSKVVFSAPASSCSELIRGIHTDLSEKLEQVEYAELNVQHRIYDRDHTDFPFKGFGVLYPRKESANILGHIWNSNIVRNKEGKTFITTMFKSENLEQTTAELDIIFNNDYGLKKDELLHVHTVKWKKAIPVYNEAHLEFLSEYKAGEEINLYFCSNLVHGVSIPDRIEASKSLAEKLN